MANRAYLLAVDDRNVTWSKSPQQEVLAEGINEIPVFWASLFTAQDRQLDAYEARHGASVDIPTWCVAADKAKARLEKLSQRVGKLLDARSRGVWNQWVEFMTDQECKFFKTNATEVWDLDPTGYENKWATLLKAFETPSKSTLKAALELNGLSYRSSKVSWSDPEETICKLAGADHIRELPWLSMDSASDASDESDLALPAGPSAWDRYMMFQKASGLPLEAAQLLEWAAGDAAELRNVDTAEITPEELAIGVLHYFEYWEMTHDECVQELKKRKLNSSADLVRALDGFRIAGLGLEFTNDDAHAFATSQKLAHLFNE